MPRISESEVRAIARLCRLTLADDEVGSYVRHLDAILDYFEELRAIDVGQVEPLAHPLPLRNITRPDEPRPGLTHEAALSAAPRTVNGHFCVPRVVDHGGA